MEPFSVMRYLRRGATLVSLLLVSSLVGSFMDHGYKSRIFGGKYQKHTLVYSGAWRESEIRSYDKLPLLYME